MRGVLWPARVWAGKHRGWGFSEELCPVWGMKQCEGGSSEEGGGAASRLPCSDFDDSIAEIQGSGADERTTAF
eukprot:366247-Chlamydomonas_euryale.AAC.1